MDVAQISGKIIDSKSEDISERMHAATPRRSSETVL